MSGAIAALERRANEQQRRELGSWFTAADVASFIASATIISAWADAIGVPEPRTRRALMHPASMPQFARTLVDEITGTGDAHEVAAAQRALSSLHVLDPCCGAGAFLLAAWSVLSELGELLDTQPCGAQLHGLDIDADAVTACGELLTNAGAIGAELATGDAARTSLLNQLPELARRGGCDVVIGNPPWVRTSATDPGSSPDAIATLATARCGNAYAWITERSLDALKPGARLGKVLPISAVCTDAFEPLRAELDRRCVSVHTSHFDSIPSTLFAGVVQRLSIVFAHTRTAAEPEPTPEPAAWHTSRYHRWRAHERSQLLQRVRHVPMPPQRVGTSIAKIGTAIEASLLDKLFRHAPLGQLVRAVRAGDASTTPGELIHYKRRWSYYLLVSDHAPPIWHADGTPRAPTECRTLAATDPDRVSAHAIIAIMSSTLFWWYFSVFTDNRNVNLRDICAFPFTPPAPALARQLDMLGHDLVDALRRCAIVRTCTYRSIGTIHNTYYRQSETRPVLDQIDQLLAEHYHFSTEERSFILDFESSYRVSAAAR